MQKTKTKQPFNSLLIIFSLLSVMAGVFFAIQKNTWPPTLTVSDAAPVSQKEMNIAKVQSSGGHAYSTKQDFKTANQKDLTLYENGVKFGTRGASEKAIKNQGGGRYALRNGILLFSTPDNTDPRKNGRVYTVSVRGVSFGPVCGNNKKEANEQCDDGNTQDGDGCSAQCTNELVKNQIDPAKVQSSGGHAYSTKQDFKTANQKDLTLYENGVKFGTRGASEKAIKNQGGGRYALRNGILLFSTPDNTDPRKNGRTYTYKTQNIVTPPPTSPPVCGNGIVESGEQCDDGNAGDGDGCSGTCQSESTSPTAVCGNGRQEIGEQCDDSNTRNGDGCNSVCLIEQTGTKDRKASLLQSPWKMGYGANATGAGYNGKIYTVTNTNDSGPGSLREGLETAGNWVIYDKSLDGKTIFLNKSIYIAKNITWDGRDALVRVAPERSKPQLTLFRFLQGNAIVHRVYYGPVDNVSLVTSNRFTGMSVTQGQDYWFDHVETTHHDDDSFGIGSESTNSAINVTVTHYKVQDSSKGLLVSQDKAKQQNAGRVGKVTIAYSNFSAKCRNFRVSGGNWVHGFNNYAHAFGGDTCGNVAGHGNKSNRDGIETPVLLAESNVYDDSNDGLAGLFTKVTTNPPFDNQGYVFTDGKNIYLNGGPNNYVFKPGDNVPGNVKRPVPPYSYSKMDASQVKNYVLKNAGVNGANIPAFK